MIPPHLTEVFGYVPKTLKRRVVNLCQMDKNLSISKVIGMCLEAGIEHLEKQIKGEPTQGSRSSRRRAA